MQFAGHSRLHQRARKLTLAIHFPRHLIKPGQQSCKGDIKPFQIERTLDVAIFGVRVQPHVQLKPAQLGASQTNGDIGLSRFEGDLGGKGIIVEVFPLTIDQQLEFAITCIKIHATIRPFRRGGKIDLAI